MPNAWLNHVRQLRKQNRHLSYRQALKQAKNTYGGQNQQAQQNQSRGGNELMGQQAQKPSTGMNAAMNMLKGMTKGGSVAGMDSRSSLTRMATRVGGRSRRKTRRSRR